VTTATKYEDNSEWKITAATVVAKRNMELMMAVSVNRTSQEYTLAYFVETSRIIPVAVVAVVWYH
jgi:hypothetical protein